MNIKFSCPLILTLLLNLIFANKSFGADFFCYMVDDLGRIRDLEFLCNNSEVNKKPLSPPRIPQNENIASSEPCPFYSEAVVAGIDRAGNVTCVTPGDGKGFGRTMVYTSDGKKQAYTVNCREYTIKPMIRVKWLNPNRSPLETPTPGNRDIGEKIMPNPGTIGDGILTGFCDQFWNKNK